MLKTARRAAAKPLRWGHPMFHTLAAMQLLLALNQGGVIPRVLSDLFAAADNIQAEHSSTDFHFRVSYLEIYNEEVWRKHVERNVPSAARSNPRWRDSSRRETSSRRKGGGGGQRAAAPRMHRWPARAAARGAPRRSSAAQRGSSLDVAPADPRKCTFNSEF